VEKLDLTKVLKEFYQPSAKEPVQVNVPAMNFLMVEGKGDPNTSLEFQHAVEALYSMSYTLKFGLKKSSGFDWKVMPLEGLWWMEDMTKFSPEKKDDWLWTVMIAQPDFIVTDQVESVKLELTKKKNPPALSLVRFERWTEGRAAQILYIGPYSGERPTIEKLHQIITESGHKLSGKHHEIYLSDPRRTAPEKLKTIIRQPFI
jgi:hypothetical protein